MIVRLVDAFFAAAGSGDLSALLALLAPDAELRAFPPGRHRGTGSSQDRSRDCASRWATP